MAIIVGSVAVDVVPSVKEFTNKARAQLVPQADKLGQDLGKHIGENIRRRLEEEFKRLPDANIGADIAKFDASVEKAKAKLDKLGNEKAQPSVTLGDAGFDAAAAKVKLRMDTLDRTSATARIGLDTKSFQSGAVVVRAAMKEFEFSKAEPEIKPLIESSSLNILKAKLDELNTKAYSPKIKVDDHESRAVIFALRARLAALDKVVADPKLDLQGFLRALAEVEKIHSELDEINRDKSEPEIVPQIHHLVLDRFRATIAELTAQSHDVEIGVDDAKGRAKLAAFQLALFRVGKDVENAELGVEGAFKIDAELAKLNAQLDEFGHKRETATVDIRGVSQSEGGMRRLIDTILAIAPAAIPVAGVLVGITGGLVGFASEAIAGLGAIGLVLKGQFSALSEDAFKLKLDNQKIAAAQALVDSAKGPKDRTAAIKKLRTAQQLLNADTKAFAPGERTLLGLVGQLNQKWRAFIFSVVPAEVAPFKDFLRFLTPLFAALKPIIVASFLAIDKLLIGARRALESPVWKRFFRFLAENAGPAILALGKIVGNLITGFLGLVIALHPLTVLVENGLISITKKFANWGKGAGQKTFQAFIQFVRDNAPALGAFLKAVGGLLVAIGKAALPIGVAELKVLTGVFVTVADFAKHNQGITKVAIAVFLLAKSLKALKLAAAIGGIAKTLATLAALSSGEATLGGIFKGKIPGGITGKGAGGIGAAERTIGGGAIATAAALAGPAILTLLAFVAIKTFDSYMRTHSPTYAQLKPIIDKQVRVDQFPGFNEIVTAIISKLIGDSIPGTPIPPTQKEIDQYGDRHQKKQKSIEDGKLGGSTRFPRGPGGIGENFTAPSTSIGGFRIPIVAIDKTAGTISSVRRSLEKNLHDKLVRMLAHDQITGKTTAARRALEKNLRDKLIRMLAHDQITIKAQAARRILGLLPAHKIVPLSAPGAAKAALEILNVDRRARGLPPLKRLPINAPGAKITQLEILNLNRAARGLPPLKRIPTTAPGAKISALQLVNLARAARGLPPLKRLPTSTPGAQGARLELINLNRAARGLPPLKKIPTNAPGATTAALQMINLDRRARGLPPLKRIPTNAPGIDSATLKFINLDRKARGLPPLKRIPTSAPGALDAKKQIQNLIDTLGRLSNKNYEFHVKGSGSWSATNLPPLTGDGGIGHGPGGAPGHATGGPIIGAGGPRQDNILIRASAGEYMQPADTVSHYGTDAMEAIRRKRALIIPGFAAGGSVNGQAIAHVDRIGGIGAILDGAKEIIPRGIGQMANTFKKAVQKFLLSFMGTPGGGVGQWIGVVRQALALLHQPLGLAGLFLKVIQGESGGNPRAINLTDSNARAGHPSVGLAQVIRGTFNAFAGPFRNVGPFLAGVSLNPLANVFAGLNYGIQTYGSVAAIPGIASLLHGGGYRPYRRGGPAAAGVPILVGEAGPEIFTPQTAGTVIPNRGGSVGTLPDAATIVHVYLGNREITDIVRTETERVSVGQARALGAGRRRLR